MLGWSVVGRYVSRTWSGTSSTAGTEPIGGSGAEDQGGGGGPGGGASGVTSLSTSSSTSQEQCMSTPGGDGPLAGLRSWGQRVRIPRPRGFRIPTFFRRKLEITKRGEEEQIHGGPGDENVPIGESSHRKPSVTFRDLSEDPLPDSFKNLKDSAPDVSDLGTKDLEAKEASYAEPELLEEGGYPEPRCLEFFDPSVPVTRDPKRGPPMRGKHSKLRTSLARLLSCIASTKVIVGCAVVLLVLVLVLAVIAATAYSPTPIPVTDPRVQWPYVTTITGCGFVKGLIHGDLFEFRGVPYALPPTGSHRFRPARSPTTLEECWSGTYYANVSRPCWGYDLQGAVVQGYEDCLLLDVLTPQLGYDAPLPVVVYIGGSSLGGYSRGWLEPKPEVIMERRFVTVIPQIRRGPLGFLPHDLLSNSTYPHASGNQGASDLAAALTWVRNNAAHFGGDPKRITVLGHEAGASLVWALLGRRDAPYLLNAAWITGASLATPFLTTSQRTGTDSVIETLKCDSLECLLSTSVEDIMEAVPLAWRRMATLHPKEHSWLVRDGIVLPNLPSPPRVPLVIGSAQQGSAERLLDRRYFLHSNEILIQTISEVLDWGRENEMVTPQNEDPNPEKNAMPVVPLNPKRMFNWYSGLVSNPWFLLNTLVSDATVTCPALDVAERLADEADHDDHRPPVYAYLARHARSSRLGDLTDGLSDIEAITGTYQLRTESDAKFVTNVQDLFFTFIYTGTPEADGSTPANHGFYLLGDTVTIEHERPECERWRLVPQFARQE
ncbi:neurotactin-like [Oratosquilla oratoria]|uniref:neurotactin-like n=1 Tax=Oratosquilla oratoria TaxID=337810 RepID=UPI003F765F03